MEPICPFDEVPPVVEMETGVVDDESVSQINIDSVEFVQFGVVPVECTAAGDELV